YSTGRPDHAGQANGNGTGGTGADRNRAATVPAFVPDLLDGDDGLPPSPDLPALHGTLGAPVDDHGDALDAHEGQYLAYFGGSYYLYGTEYGCGTHVDLSDDAPFCGFVTYRSADLTHWHRVGEYRDARVRAVCASYCAFPKVLFSPRLHRYLLYFSSDNGGNHGDDIPSSRWLAESSSPAGPWRDLHDPGLLHDDGDAYSIAVARDGTAYMYETKDGGGLQPAEVWVERLDADRAGPSGEGTLLGHSVSSNVQVFPHGRYWYMTVAAEAKYFGPAALEYLRADSPTGPWRELNGDGTPTVLTGDSCGGTAQGVSVLPSAHGPVPVEMIDLYRSSPGDADPRLPDRARHGDWNQAVAGRYWAPLRFDDDGGIRPVGCGTATHLPLAPSAPAPAGPAAVYQPDCRVTATGEIEQDWTVRRDLRVLRVPVFQRAYLTSGMLFPSVQPPTAVDGNLTVRLSTPHGRQRWTFRPGDVSWAPRSVTLHLRRPVPAGTRVALRFGTAATDGCYGVLVVPTVGGADDRYEAIAGGRVTPAPDARLLLAAGGPGRHGQSPVDPRTR
ncbi:MAG: family 43 glycosylhydrolase, partial [Actinocatenispora sp.]